MWLGVMAWICEALETVADDAAAPPKVTVAPDAKFAPLMVTVVPPEMGPVEGEIPLMTGAADAAMFTLKLAAAALPEESFT